MNEKTLVIISIIVSITGIIIMFLANKLTQPEIVKINQISIEKNYVAFNSTITSVQTKTGLIILNLKDETGNIQGIIYSDDVKYKPGEKVKIIGKPQKYKEKTQVFILNITSI
ncbi:MAG: OB-fold nucleic acid binding domain-containing protein [Candidatus Aenigmatarchaeota archaeon]|nr:OB-fold nucleic acid binding domain-containing protein [Candidatus Aenigmarchaeota archaeon]